MNGQTSRRAAIAVSCVAVFAALRLVLGAPALRSETEWYTYSGLDAATDRELSHRVVVVKDNRKALRRWRLWAGALSEGARLALVGSTTLVFASAPSEPAILEAVKLGRTYVRLRNARGPSIEFRARLGGRTYRLGDTIPIGPFTTIVLEATLSGAEGQTLHWIRAGEQVETVEISGLEAIRTTVQARPGDWFSIVIVDDLGPALLTGAIYTEEQ